jgi:hypothetical protein
VGIDLLEGAVTGNFDGPDRPVTEKF